MNQHRLYQFGSPDAGEFSRLHAHTSNSQRMCPEVQKFLEVQKAERGARSLRAFRNYPSKSLVISSDRARESAV